MSQVCAERFRSCTWCNCPRQRLTYSLPTQTGILSVFRSVLPPLSNGLGPRWTRIIGYTPAATAADGVNITMLMYNSRTPLNEFMTVRALGCEGSRHRCVSRRSFLVPSCLSNAIKSTQAPAHVRAPFPTNDLEPKTLKHPAALEGALNELPARLDLSHL